MAASFLSQLFRKKSLQEMKPSSEKLKRLFTFHFYLSNFTQAMFYCLINTITRYCSSSTVHILKNSLEIIYCKVTLHCLTFNIICSTSFGKFSCQSCAKFLFPCGLLYLIDPLVCIFSCPQSCKQMPDDSRPRCLWSRNYHWCRNLCPGGAYS